MTLAELKRTLKPGTKLTVVHTYLGPVKFRRTVNQVFPTRMTLWGHGDPDDRLKLGSLSHMDFGLARNFESVANGFRFYDNNDHGAYVEYKWGWL